MSLFTRLYDYFFSTPTIRFVKVRISAKPPFKNNKHDAGWDMHACTEHNMPVLIPADGVVKIPSGIKMMIPKGWCGYIITRSSGTLKQLDISGVIDSGYTGEVQIIVRNVGTSSVLIQPGERIAQLLLVKVPSVKWIEVDSLEQTERGENGFGSSGKL